MDAHRREVFTIGHSNHPIERLLGLLERHAVTAVADVRSIPYSRRSPQFSRPALKHALLRRGLEYLFLGEELGARPKDLSCWRGGAVDYRLLAANPAFREGLHHVQIAAGRCRLALMCAEKEPLDCHRAILVSRHLTLMGIGVIHILADGGLEDHDVFERRLLALTGMAAPPLLSSLEDEAAALERAYEIRGRALANRGNAPAVTTESPIRRS